jgi:hypothetical protein
MIATARDRLSVYRSVLIAHSYADTRWYGSVLIAHSYADTRRYRSVLIAHSYADTRCYGSVLIAHSYADTRWHLQYNNKPNLTSLLIPQSWFCITLTSGNVLLGVLPHTRTHGRTHTQCSNGKCRSIYSPVNQLQVSQVRPTATLQAARSL